MRIRVDPRSAVPPSRQLVAAVLDALAAGELGAGDRLPSVRTLATEALVNPNTVGKAYRELEVSGVVEGRNGSGVFVTAQGPRLARHAREAHTLAEFAAAARAALRCGHGIDELRMQLERLAAAAPQQRERA